MTAHNGQGDIPREGVVLPSGGDGRPAGQDRDRMPDQAPAAGQPWGGPWGPEPASAQLPPGGTAGYGYPHSQPSTGYGYPHSPPVPPAGPPASAPLPPATPPAAQAVPPPPAGPPPGPPQAQPYQPSYPSQPDQFGQPAGQPPAGAQPLPPAAPPTVPAEHQLPPANTPPYPPSTGQYPGPLPEPGTGRRRAPKHGSGAHRAPEPGAGSHRGPEGWQSGASPSGQPPTNEADATQFLPPVTDFPPPDTQLPPVEAGFGASGAHQAPEMDATQFLPPQPDGDLDATQYIPPIAKAPDDPYTASDPSGGGQARPEHGVGTEEEGAHRLPPAEFENLFRPEGGGGRRRAAPRSAMEEEPKSTTQPLPLFEHAVATQSGARPSAGQPGRQEPLGPPEPVRRSRRAAPSGTGGSANRRPLLLGAGGVAILIAAGLLGGAALGGGDDEGEGEQAAPTAPADGSGEPEPSPDPSEEKPDPVEVQAKELDKLLADSNNSRAAVIRSVENIKKCAALPQSEKDLRDAADQRTSLVTRLDELTVEKLPRHQQLTAQLRKAWEASAQADLHFANWAKEQQDPKNCKDGKPRTTPQLVSANRNSGTATKAKQRAARLWNPTAREHDLPERQPTQL